MKHLFKTFVLVVAFLSFQCSSSDNNSNDEVITQPILDAKKTEIINYINSFDCSGSCNYIAFGSKPCGGPKEYLLFSSSVNLIQLQQMVSEYNEMDHQHNIQTNAISDCAVVLPPNSVECVNGDCLVIN
ncbi:hypothetical protein [Flavobacterium sp.]|uniref:hypothetical protein n=1 Tax=Flavobacterium sp. TaxID=239 RepID=UPI00261D59F9|nr:hypothetical protein [Flavobacterium sp.]